MMAKKKIYAVKKEKQLEFLKVGMNVGTRLTVIQGQNTKAF